MFLKKNIHCHNDYTYFISLYLLRTYLIYSIIHLENPETRQWGFPMNFLPLMFSFGYAAKLTYEQGF